MRVVFIVAWINAVGLVKCCRICCFVVLSSCVVSWRHVGCGDITDASVVLVVIELVM